MALPAREFVLQVPGYPVTHIYRSAFPRPTTVVHMRPQLFGKDDSKVGAVVYMTRPRGYFGIGRDRMVLDGSPPPGIPREDNHVSVIEFTY